MRSTSIAENATAEEYKPAAQPLYPKFKAWRRPSCRIFRHATVFLAVVGTHDTRGLQRLLLGGTARTEVHDCPRPVWVSKPAAKIIPRNILVASDLSPLSDEVVCIGIDLGGLADAHTHVLDVIEFTLDRLRSPPGASLTRQYHTRVRDEVERAARTNQAQRRPRA